MIIGFIIFLSFVFIVMYEYNEFMQRRAERLHEEEHTYICNKAKGCEIYHCKCKKPHIRDWTYTCRYRDECPYQHLKCKCVKYYN